MKTYSPLDNAVASADRTGRLIRWAMLLPVPIIAAAVVALQIGAPGKEGLGHGGKLPAWFEDPFLLTMFAIFVFGQISVLKQYRSIQVGLSKVKKVLAVLTQSGNESLTGLQSRLQTLGVTGHLYDLVTRSLAFGTKGDTSPLPAMMDHATLRRMKSVEKKVGVHAAINRVLLKLGFLGTLIGLIMTFPPMRDAILALDPKSAEKGSSFVEHIAGAIDGDQYAILATMIATGLSILIELLTISMLKRICATFEAVNGYVEEWSITELQPWIKEQVVGKDDPIKLMAQWGAFQKQMIEMEMAFQKQMVELKEATQNQIMALYRGAQEGWVRLQKESETIFQKALKDTEARIQETQAGVNRNVDVLGGVVQHVAQKLNEIPPIQQAFARRMDELLAYERQYRSFLNAQSQVQTPRHLIPGAVA
ncbi:MAG TPA: hypothetical protein VK465_09955 [Fibrobacteria bacterium]|nr:hypothetical protein [Fibrobacteria bacterium]